jgi:hypothetical protein
MLALAEYRASRCPCGCGHNIAETTAPEGTHRWRARKVRCYARDAMVAAQEAAQTKNVTRPEARLWWSEKE